MNAETAKSESKGGGKRRLPKPPKVGEIVKDKHGMEMIVTSVSHGPLGYRFTKCAEPIAKKKGFITTDQIAGFRTEHHPPPFVPHGTARDSAALTDADWNFIEVMKRPVEEKKVALFHELARESARVREACRILKAGSADEHRWRMAGQEADRLWMTALKNAKALAAKCERLEAKLKSTAKPSQKIIKEFDAKKQERDRAYEQARLAESASRRISVESGNGRERQAYQAATSFLERIERRFPFGTGEMIACLVAEDRGWNSLSADEKRDVLKIQSELETKRVKHPGRSNKDVPCSGPGWLFSDPIQFANRHWQELKSEWPGYGYNDGKPGRMVLAPRGNGSDAPLVLSESLELCVCLNFSDDEIVNSFRRWLQWRRENLHDELDEFRQGNGVGDRMNPVRIDAAFKALAALRLRAKFKSKKVAAITFREIYEPNTKRIKKKKEADAAPLADVKKLADEAVKLGREFLPNCPLDSAPVDDPRKRPWDHLCSHCGKLQSRGTDAEPKQRQYTEWRCQKCDHREDSRWDGRAWILCDE